MRIDPCPRCDPAIAEDAAALARVLAAEPWLTATLDAVEASGVPSAWIGAGALRDVVWGQRYGGFDPGAVRDIDVAFLDVDDLTRERDAAVQAQLAARLDRPWEATNQAAVHTWYPAHFGGPEVEPLASVHDAVATWPETATCVAVRRKDETLEVCAPLGLRDLLDGVWRRNPARVSVEQSRARLDRQRVAERWPQVRIHRPG